MNAPPPSPELCGSTSDSIAWTAIGGVDRASAAAALPSPARAASGLAAMTKPVPWLRRLRRGGAQEPPEEEDGQEQETQQDIGSLRRRLKPVHRAMAGAAPDPLNSGTQASARGAEGRTSVARTQLEHFPNLVTMFLTRARERATSPSCGPSAPARGRSATMKRRGRWRRCRQPESIGLKPGDRDAGQRESAGMADRRPRHHGGSCVTVPTYTTNTSAITSISWPIPAPAR